MDTDIWENEIISSHTASFVFNTATSGILISGSLSIIYLLGFYNKIPMIRYSTERSWFLAQILALLVGTIFGILLLTALKTQSTVLCKLIFMCSSTSYLSVKYALYFFLLLRSRTAKFGRPRWLTFLERTILFVMIVGNSLAAILGLLSLTTTILPIEDTEGTICYFRLSNLSIILFVAVDFISSLGFLFLFIVPFYLNDSKDKEVRRIMIENLIISSTVITSTFASLIFWMNSENATDTFYSMSICVMDSLLNQICACVITRKAWSRRRKETHVPNNRHGISSSKSTPVQ